jgi:hypothetical protein
MQLSKEQLQMLDLALAREQLLLRGRQLVFGGNQRSQGLGTKSVQIGECQH